MSRFVLTVGVVWSAVGMVELFLFSAHAWPSISTAPFAALFDALRTYNIIEYPKFLASSLPNRVRSVFLLSGCCFGGSRWCSKPFLLVLPAFTHWHADSRSANTALTTLPICDAAHGMLDFLVLVHLVLVIRRGLGCVRGLGPAMLSFTKFAIVQNVVQNRKQSLIDYRSSASPNSMLY